MTDDNYECQYKYEETAFDKFTNVCLWVACAMLAVIVAILAVACLMMAVIVLNETFGLLMETFSG